MVFNGMTRLFPLLALVAALFTHGDGMAASFDCSKPGMSVEKAVCADPVLSKLDDEVAARYAAAMKALSPEGQAILHRGQRDWLRYIQLRCVRYGVRSERSQCLFSAYTDRAKDMKSAAVRIGSFLFSRIDYFYVHKSTRPEDPRPAQGRTAYPRIDQPLSASARQWNAAMAPSSHADEDGCDGPGDISNSFTIRAVSSRVISTEVSDFMYCHTAHGYGGSHSVNYVLSPDFHSLMPGDLFVDQAPWRDFLTNRSMAMIEEAKPDSKIDREAIGTRSTTSEIGRCLLRA